jgi:EAL domain-containing protein (putative c-di-GMP-specific phosphodiesterase class I)
LRAYKRASVVDAILRLARSLDLTTVGEGIEHVSQARALDALGCRFGQGYLFSPPLAAEEVPVFLRTGRALSDEVTPSTVLAVMPGALG